MWMSNEIYYGLKMVMRCIQSYELSMFEGTNRSINQMCCEQELLWFDDDS
jgi:hypothetical protein